MCFKIFFFLHEKQRNLNVVNYAFLRFIPGIRGTVSVDTSDGAYDSGGGWARECVFLTGGKYFYINPTATPAWSIGRFECVCG